MRQKSNKYSEMYEWMNECYEWSLLIHWQWHLCPFCVVSHFFRFFFKQRVKQANHNKSPPRFLMVKCTGITKRGMRTRAVENKTRFYCRFSRFFFFVYRSCIQDSLSLCWCCTYFCVYDNNVASILNILHFITLSIIPLFR